jgi:hypothetical protein
VFLLSILFPLQHATGTEQTTRQDCRNRSNYERSSNAAPVSLFLIGGIVIVAVILLAVAAFVRVKKRLRF